MSVHDKAIEWINAEWEGHAQAKYGDGAAGREVNTQGITEMDYDRLFAFVGNYLKRVEMFGLDTLQGRQALGKAATTLVDYMQRTMEIHGDFPKPGLPSGEIQEW